MKVLLSKSFYCSQQVRNNGLKRQKTQDCQSGVLSLVEIVDNNEGGGLDFVIKIYPFLTFNSLWNQKIL